MIFTFKKDTFTVSTDHTLLDLDVIYHYLAKESYWARGRKRHIIEKAVANSLPFGLYDGDSQIGFSRVVTDYATYAYLSDVFVLPAYQGRGLGTWMLECILKHPDLSGIRRFMLVTGDAQEYYKKYGWHPVKQPERHMERLNSFFDSPL